MSFEVDYGGVPGYEFVHTTREVVGNMRPVQNLYRMHKLVSENIFVFCSVPLDFGRAAAKRSDRWIRAPGAPEARFARGFWPASTGRSAWTALRAARSRQSWFGLRVAVGAHTQGLRLRSKAEQHTEGRKGVRAQRTGQRSGAGWMLGRGMEALVVMVLRSTCRCRWLCEDERRT